MTPLQYYQNLVKDDLIQSDPLQLEVLAKFEKTFNALIAEQKKRSKFFNYFRKRKAVTGIYIYGGVGIGKTLLMDCFYQALPFEAKRRLHFHQFMREVHLSLKTFQGEENPLKSVAEEIAKITAVFCLDELLVSDITDAMILRRLFQALYAAGVTLIITSNMAPDDLYKNGLQRISFLPAIAFIKAHFQAINLQIESDYRLRHLQKAGVFFVPSDEAAFEEMEKCFQLLNPKAVFSSNPIVVYDREIAVIKETQDCVWFDFKDILKPPRSQQDYLWLTEKYHTIFISHIPKISEDQRDLIALFIRMIDVFYDAKVRLICAAECVPSELYVKGHALFDFQRTQSRLLEMQSEHYFTSGKA